MIFIRGIIVFIDEISVFLVIFKMLIVIVMRVVCLWVFFFLYEDVVFLEGIGKMRGGMNLKVDWFDFCFCSFSFVGNFIVNDVFKFKL